MIDPHLYFTEYLTVLFKIVAISFHIVKDLYNDFCAGNTLDSYILARLF